MRSILRSAFLASFAVSMTVAFSGCEDTTKPVTPPPATAGDSAIKPADSAPKDKMEPAAAPAPEKPADAPK